MRLVINNEEIAPELIEEEFSAIKAQFEQMGRVSCCERDSEFRGYARDNIIARALLNQEAERRFPQLAAEEIQAVLQRVVAEHGGAEAFCQKMGLASLDDPMLRQDVSAGARMDKMLMDVWGAEQDPDDSELRAFMEENRALFLTDERVRASHLFKLVDKVEERERIYNLLREIRHRAKNGEDFDALANEHTDKEDKLVDLGFFKRGEFMDEFDLIVFSLDVGEVSPVFASHFGFHLAKVTGHEPRKLKPFEEIREELRERVIAARREVKTKALIAKLRAEATILTE